MVRSLIIFVLCAAACTVHREPPNLVGQDVRVTVIHTSDIHSRLFPYHFVPGRVDQNYGLRTNEGPYGGIARIGAIVREERAKASRSIWLDSGDCFQGAPIFNLYKGEAEFRALTELGLDAAVIGNHEFDLGSNNLYEQMVSWAGFDLLAANYFFEDTTEPNKPKLGEIVPPYQLYDLNGVVVAVIGMANWSSMTGILEGGNSLGLRPLDDAMVVDNYVGLLRPVADIVVLVSHLGLDEDEGLSANEVDDMNMELLTGCGPDGMQSCLDGVDLILGGHLHIVLNPPKIAQTDSYGHPTVLVHSGAFAKYVGRLDLVVHKGTNNADPANRSYITAFTYENLPVACGFRAPDQAECTNPSDPDVVALLQPYSLELNQLLDLDGVFAYINTTEDAKIVRNDASGGDSQLGNLVARAMQQRPGVDADFAITNSLGIRADFESGPLTLEALYNVFPFENSITVMFLSGSEVRETLDFVARKSSERGCRTQAQMAGIWWDMVCGEFARAENIYIGEDCRLPDGTIDDTKCRALVDTGLYRVAVNDYIAAGGSGFTVLKRNTSKLNTGVALRAALQDYIRGLPECGATVLDPTDPASPQAIDACADLGQGDACSFSHDGRDLSGLCQPEGGAVACIPTVRSKHGPITCLDTTIEPHDDRIFPRFE